MSLARPVSQWLTIYATQTDGTPASISARILKDVFGYNTRTRTDRWRKDDEETLANALIAYRQFANELVDEVEPEPICTQN